MQSKTFTILVCSLYSDAPGVLNLLALVNFTAQHSIPAVISTVSAMFTRQYGLEDISLVSEPFTYSSFQEGRA